MLSLPEHLAYLDHLLSGRLNRPRLSTKRRLLNEDHPLEQLERDGVLPCRKRVSF
jgi:hypothetical protein